MVCGQVLRGLVRVVQEVAAIFQMVVSFRLPMQRCVVDAGPHVRCRADARQRHGLPEHGKKHDDEDG